MKSTLYSSALIPLQTNSNRVLRFSGLGAVTNIFEYLKNNATGNSKINIMVEQIEIACK